MAVGGRSALSLRAVVLGAEPGDDVVSEWDALAETAVDQNVLFGPSLARSAMRHLPGCRATRLVAVTERPGSGGRLLGLLPVKPAPGLPGLRVVTAGNWDGFGPFGAPLLDRDQPVEAATALLDGLAAAGLGRFLLLRGVAENAPAATALAASLALRGRRMAALDRHGRAMLSIPQPDDSGPSALSGKKRKELRRQLRRLEDELGPVTFQLRQDPDGVDAMLQDYLALEDGGWKGRWGTSLLRKPAQLTFFREAIGGLARSGRARIALLAAGDRPVAAGIVLTSGRSAWYFKTAYDEALARFSPGVQLTLALTEALLADRTIDTVDSIAVAGHPMIDHVWSERLPIADWLIELRPGDPLFAAARGFEIARRRALETARPLVHKLREFRR